MSEAPVNITDFPLDAQAFIAAQAAELTNKDAELMGLTAARVADRTAFTKTIQNRDLVIADLRMQLDGHKKYRFGSRSEHIDQLTLELVLEEHEIAQAADEPDEDVASASDKEAKPPRTPRKRKPFPKDLKRVETRITPSDSCADCGGSFKELGVDVMTELEYVPGHFITKDIIRPRLACTCCEKIVQSEMPSRPIPKSFVGPALMAHILTCKYGDHLPLYRLSLIFERQGIDLSRALLASWVGKATKLLECLSDATRDHVLAADAIFMDDTTVKLLQKARFSGMECPASQRDKGKNKPKTARLWDYVRDERPWGSASPPAVWYQFSTSRGAEHPNEHLKTYKGFAHADAYAGYNDLYRTGRVTQMACMVHIRREFVKVYDSSKSATAKEAIERIAKLYAVEKLARGKPPKERVSIRQQQAKQIFPDFVGFRL